jgi:hypothetical protein
MWWIWNKFESKWGMTDKTDILNSIKSTINWTLKDENIKWLEEK